MVRVPKRAGLVLLAAMCIGGTTAQAGGPPARLKAEPYPVHWIDPGSIASTWRRQVVTSPFAIAPGSIVIDTRTRLLYLQLDGGRALRYGVAVGRAGHAWHGEAIVAKKKKWPTWTPTQSMTGNASNVSFTFEGGPGNPMGARALYLSADGKDTGYRIHGSGTDNTIGRPVSHGCIRMLDQDVIDLYDRVAPGAEVHVIGDKGVTVGSVTQVPPVGAAMGRTTPRNGGTFLRNDNVTRRNTGAGANR